MLASLCIVLTGCQEVRDANKNFARKVVCMLRLGCEEAADLAGARVIDQEGIRFSLPGNWHIDEQHNSNSVKTLSVNTQGHTLLSINVANVPRSNSLADFADAVLTQVAENMPVGYITGIETSQITRDVLGESFDGVEKRYTINFMGTATKQTSQFFSIETERHSTFFVTYVTAGESKLVDPGFDLILSTFHIAPD